MQALESYPAEFIAVLPWLSSRLEASKISAVRETLAMKYLVDLRDIQFQLFEWLDLEQVLSAKRYADWDVENLDLVIGEAVKIAEEELARWTHPNSAS